MLREISSGIIQSSDGFIVNNHGHFEILYIEGDHIVNFYVEPGAKTYLYFLDEPARWNAPYSGEAISPEYQKIIKDRIVSALKFRGHEVTVYR